MTGGKFQKMCNRYVRTGECLQCGECCKVLKIKLDKRIDGDTKHFYEVRGLEVKLGSRWTVLTIPNFPCKYLDGDGKCRLHNTEKKPLVCWVYPTAKWHMLDGCGYDIKPKKE